MRRASSSLARRTPTTSASSTCVSSCAGEWRPRSARRPVRSAAVARRRRAAPTTWRARARCSTSCRRSRAGCRPIDDLRREIARANAARAAARRLVALRRIVPRVTGAEVFPLLAAFWEMDPDRYAAMASDAATSDCGAPAAGRSTRAARRRACGRSRRCTRRSNRTAPSSLTKSARGEAARRETTCACDDDPVAALADKYRADAIGARTPVGALRRVDASSARRRRCRRRVAAAGRCGVRLGLSGAARRAAGATHSARLFARRSVSGADSAGSRSSSTRWCAAASRLQEARHG